VLLPTLSWEMRRSITNGSDPAKKSIILLEVFVSDSLLFVYYESIKRKLKIKPIYECRCDGRIQTKRFTRLSYTGLVVELEHLKVKTRLTNEKFASVKGEYEIYMR
jgi:hypothetical protein